MTDLLSTLRSQYIATTPKSFSEILSNVKANLDPVQTPQLRSQMTKSVKDQVKSKIGDLTFLFLENDPQFSRCIDLLATSQMLLGSIEGKVFISIGVKREFSYIVSPASKALEGTLLAIALRRKMITQADIDRGIKIGEIYPDKAKKFVLKDKEKSTVTYIFSNYQMFRNKVLHFDEDHFVNNVPEAEELIDGIYKTIRLTYQTFVGSPTLKLPILQKIS